MNLDTNTALYHSKDLLDPPLPVAFYSISVVTEIEALAYPSLSADEEGWFRRLFREDVRVIDLSAAIKERAVIVTSRGWRDWIAGS